jgi:hypothetical protein
MILLEGVATRLQWTWNETNGEAGNFYTVLLRGSFFIVLVRLLMDRQDTSD